MKSWKVLSLMLVVSVAAVSPAAAERDKLKPPMPAGYDDAGPAPENPLPKILAKLRTTLNDPYSIRDFTMCAPARIEPYYGLDWVRARWNVKITLNAKNSYGGYTGSTMFDVSFKDGDVVEISQFKGIAALDEATNYKLIAAAQACPHVPDAKIQELLTS